MRDWGLRIRGYELRITGYASYVSHILAGKTPFVSGSQLRERGLTGIRWYTISCYFGITLHAKEVIKVGYYHKMVAVVWGGSRQEADFQVFEFHEPGWKEGDILGHHVWVGTPGKKEDELPPRVKDTCYCFASCQCGTIRADCHCDPGVHCAIGCATPGGWVTCESHCTG
jgi:hypothetical protein